MPARTPKRLSVLIGGDVVGRLSQMPDGSLRFSYESGYSGVPLSLCMPVSNVAYGDDRVRPYLAGLLPEDDKVRRSVAREHGVSANNPYALVACMGLDLPGAVQVCAEHDLDDVLGRAGAYVEVTEADIASRLATISGPEPASWFAPDEHWSLGGQQAKIALARFDGRWYSCEGSAATTHIIKPGIRHLNYHALNEHFCLKLAGACGIPVATSEYAEFDGQAAIVVTRYDRLVRAPFEVTRIHQEDLCQALGVPPQNKYADEGGPSARDIVSLLDKHDGAQANKLAFTSQLVFNYLIGATDAHAKNYSALLKANKGPLLAPMYDVASALAYDHDRRTVRLAMGIGGENRLGRVSEGNLRRYADMALLDQDLVVSLTRDLATRIREVVADIAGMVDEEHGGRELTRRLVPEILGSCETAERAFSPHTPARDIASARKQAAALDETQNRHMGRRRTR